MPSPPFSLCDDGDDRGMVGLGCPWRWARQSGQVLESESVGATCSYPVVFLWLRLRCISYPRRQAAGAVHAIDSDSVKEHGIFFWVHFVSSAFPVVVNKVPKKYTHLYCMPCNNADIINR
jgi:hypothetical protein